MAENKLSEVRSSRRSGLLGQGPWCGHDCDLSMVAAKSRVVPGIIGVAIRVAWDHGDNAAGTECGNKSGRQG